MSAMVKFQLPQLYKTINNLKKEHSFLSSKYCTPSAPILKPYKPIILVKFEK